MAGFPEDVLAAAAVEREVTLTTRGRVTGKPSNVTIWVSTDGRSIFIRSGAGLGRHWPQNFLKHGEATLRLGKRSVRVKPRHVIDRDKARAVSQMLRDKYGDYVKPSKRDEPLTPGEQATFELIPAG